MVACVTSDQGSSAKLNRPVPEVVVRLRVMSDAAFFGVLI